MSGIVFHLEGSERAHLIHIESAIREGIVSLFQSTVPTPEKQGWNMIRDALVKDELTAWRWLKSKFREDLVQLRHNNAMQIVSITSSADVRAKFLDEEIRSLSEALLNARKELANSLEQGQSLIHMNTAMELAKLDRTKKHLLECLQDMKCKASQYQGEQDTKRLMRKTTKEEHETVLSDMSEDIKRLTVTRDRVEKECIAIQIEVEKSTRELEQTQREIETFEMLTRRLQAEHKAEMVRFNAQKEYLEGQILLAKQQSYSGGGNVSPVSPLSHTRVVSRRSPTISHLVSPPEVIAHVVSSSSNSMPIVPSPQSDSIEKRLEALQDSLSKFRDERNRSIVL
eukprot:PhF_6_TR20992/c1_g1_i1/m.30118